MIRVKENGARTWKFSVKNGKVRVGEGMKWWKR